MTKILRQYQLDAVKRATSANLLLCDDCGLGKTAQAVVTAILLMNDLNAPTLVVAPKSVIQQWVMEIEDFSKLPIFILTSDFNFTAEFKSFTSKKPFWVLTNPEALVKFQKNLAKTKWALVVADEAHRYKNRKAKRTKALKALRPNRRLAMTGTPFNRHIDEYWSLLNWLDPQGFSSYWRFVEKWLVQHYNGYGTEIVGVQDAEKFAAMLSNYVLRRTKQDVAPELPAKQFVEVPIELGDDQRELYDRIDNVEDCVVDVGDRQLLITIVLTKILRLQQAASNPKLIGAYTSRAKIEWLLDWIEDNPEESVIIFTKFRDTALELGALTNADLVMVGGTTKPPVDRIRASRRIVATIRAAGEGLDLPHIDYAIFLEREWSSIDMRQAVDRIDRLGITKGKTIYYLNAINSVDQLVREIVEHGLSQKELIDRFLALRAKI